jgi:hypothetical protein
VRERAAGTGLVGVEAVRVAAPADPFAAGCGLTSAPGVGSEVPVEVVGAGMRGGPSNRQARSRRADLGTAGDRARAWATDQAAGIQAALETRSKSTCRRATSLREAGMLARRDMQRGSHTPLMPVEPVDILWDQSPQSTSTGCDAAPVFVSTPGGARLALRCGGAPRGEPPGRHVAKFAGGAPRGRGAGLSKHQRRGLGHLAVQKPSTALVGPLPDGAPRSPAATARGELRSTRSEGSGLILFAELSSWLRLAHGQVIGVQIINQRVVVRRRMVG